MRRIRSPARRSSRHPQYGSKGSSADAFATAGTIEVRLKPDPTGTGVHVPAGPVVSGFSRTYADEPRLTRRIGVVDPESLDDYRAHGGYEALRRAFELGPDGVLREVIDSKLLGRGGAAFPM